MYIINLNSQFLLKAVYTQWGVVGIGLLASIRENKSKYRNEFILLVKILRMKKSKLFEKVVQIVQESYRDHPNTEITHQYKIPNISGRKREIDILIETRVNNIEIKVAIECKDHSRKIEAKEIEAFHSKCLRIPEINKKLFVSRKGYAADAINAAKDFGVELLLLENLSIESFKDWLTIPMIRQIDVMREFVGLALEFTEEPKIEFEVTDEITIKETGQKFRLIDFMRQYVTENFSPPVTIWKTDEKNMYFVIEIQFNGVTIKKENITHGLNRLRTTLVYQIFERPTTELFNRYSKFQSEDVRVDVASSISNDNEIVSLVKRDDKELIEVFKGIGTGKPRKYAEMKISKIEKNGS